MRDFGILLGTGKEKIDVLIEACGLQGINVGIGDDNLQQGD
jgi:hypothetical protein